MALGDTRQSWKKLDVADEVTALISRDQTGPEWSGAGASIASEDSFDIVLPTKVHTLAGRIVNNRVTEPAAAIAYGKESDTDYAPEQPGDSRFEGSLIRRMISARSYLPYLMTRLFWTLAITGISTIVFYGLAWWGVSYGWTGGMMALGTSALVVLGWLLLRIVREQTNSRGGGFFRHSGSLAPIQATSTAIRFLDNELTKFVDEISDFQADCIARSDQLPRQDQQGSPQGTKADFCDNANSMAQSMVTWAIARRAAQYLSFQPVNIKEQYGINGVSKARIAAWETSFNFSIWTLIGLFVAFAIFVPNIMNNLRPEMAVSLWAVDLSGRTIFVWPLIHAAFAAFIALWLSSNDKRTYKKDRNRVTLALTDFWRSGTARTADEISALQVESSATYTDWFDKAAYRMILQKTKAPRGQVMDKADADYAKWLKIFKWSDDLVGTDPTPKLMRRYLKFLDTVGARSVVHNRKMAPSPLLSPRRANMDADARPRTRALATLTRREIWHP